jgi:hypothetical protein
MRNTLLLNIVKFLAMAVGLAICGVILAVAGAFIGGKGFSNDVYSSLGLAFIGVITGYLAGNVIGIVLIKKILHQSGSILLSILGCIAGIAITLVITITLDPDINVFFWMVIVSVPVLCLSGFHLKK